MSESAQFAQNVSYEQGWKMGLVMIGCPVTGHEISIGMQASRLSFNRSPVFFGDTLCPVAEGITNGLQKTRGSASRRRNMNSTERPMKCGPRADFIDPFRRNFVVISKPSNEHVQQ